MAKIFFWKSFSIKEFLWYNLYYKWKSQLCLNTSTFPSFKNHWPSMIWTFNYENKQETKLNIICFAYSHHLALKFPKKIFVVPIFVQELQDLQYTKRNDPKSVFPRPDQIDPYTLNPLNCCLKRFSPVHCVFFHAISDGKHKKMTDCITFNCMASFVCVSFHVPYSCMDSLLCVFFDDVSEDKPYRMTDYFPF